MDGPSNAGCDSDERVHLPPDRSKCLDVWVVFRGFFIVCGVWEFVVTICEFNELYDVWWGWR